MSPEPSTLSVITDDNLGDIQIGYEDVPDITPASTPEVTPEEKEPEAKVEPEVTTPAPIEEDSFIKIDRKKLRDELRRLEKEDPEFANQYNIHVGDKAARKYKPIIDDLTAERDAAIKELRRREMLALPDAEKAEKFEKDPAWAREYADLVHTNPGEIIAKARAEAEANRTQQLLIDSFQKAQDNGLPKEVADTIFEDVKQGKYDRDEDGRMRHPLEGIALIQQALTDRLLETARAGNVTPSPAPVVTKQEPEAQPPNPALLAPGPDTSTTGTVRAGGSRDPVVDYQKALADGRTLPAEEIDKITRKYLEME